MRISDWSSDVCSSDLLWYRERDDKIISRSAEGTFAPHSGSDLAKKLANMMGKIEHEHDRIRGFIMVSPYISKDGETSFAPFVRNFQNCPMIVVNNERLSSSDFRAFVEKIKRSQEHTSELQSLMRTSYAFFCLQNTIKQ